MENNNNTITEILFDARNYKSSITLKGTLALPQSNGPVPLIVLVTGTGAHNRDEQIGEYRPFKEISDHLVNNGFAVVRYDDRHYGLSAKSGWKFTTEDFVTDVLAVIDSVTNDNIQKYSSIGIVGHSEGGIIAAMAALQNSKISAIIGLGSPAISLREIGIQQANDLSGGDEKKRKYKLGINEIIRTEKNESLRRLKIWKIYFQNYGFFNFREAIKQYQWMDITASNWCHFSLNIESVNIFSKIKCPSLMVFAENDIQIHCRENVHEIERINQKHGTNIESRIIANTNHLFQESISIHEGDYDSLVKSYMECKTGISKSALESILDWLKITLNPVKVD